MGVDKKSQYMLGVLVVISLLVLASFVLANQTLSNQSNETVSITPNLTNITLPDNSTNFTIIDLNSTDSNETVNQSNETAQNETIISPINETTEDNSTELNLTPKENTTETEPEENLALLALEEPELDMSLVFYDFEDSGDEISMISLRSLNEPNEDIILEYVLEKNKAGIESTLPCSVAPEGDEDQLLRVDDGEIYIKEGSEDEKLLYPTPDNSGVFSRSDLNLA